MDRSQHTGNMQYLVTGAGGFIGREIIAQLCGQGDAVRGLVRRKNPAVPMPGGAEIIEGDILNPGSLDALFDGTIPGQSVMIHAAAHISLRRRDKTCENINLAGTRNIIEACIRHGVRRLVHFSSVDALPPCSGEAAVSEPECLLPDRLPTSYGRSKAASAQLVMDAAKGGLDCTLLFPSAVAGPGDYRRGFITQMLALCLRDLPRISVAGGYEFVDVRDVAAAAIAAAKGRGSGCYILSNRYASITSVFDMMAQCTGRKPTAITLPIGALYPVVPILSALYRLAGKEPPLTLEALRLMRTHPRYCHDRAARELGFSPRPLDQTFMDTAGFLLRQHK